MKCGFRYIYPPMYNYDSNWSIQLVSDFTNISIDVFKGKNKGNTVLLLKRLYFSHLQSFTMQGKFLFVLLYFTTINNRGQFEQLLVRCLLTQRQIQYFADTCWFRYFQLWREVTKVNMHYRRLLSSEFLKFLFSFDSSFCSPLKLLGSTAFSVKLPSKRSSSSFRFLPSAYIWIWYIQSFFRITSSTGLDCLKWIKFIFASNFWSEIKFQFYLFRNRKCCWIEFV